ncbi:MAG: hypothetical protein ACTSWY_13650 [Promethearchaeota archaeon]
MQQRSIFLIKSSSIKYKGYNWKNIPVSTGRADVLARVIIAALIKPPLNNNFSENNSIQSNNSCGIMIFPNNTFITELSDFLLSKNENKNGNKLKQFSVMITLEALFFVKAISNEKTLFSELEILQALYKSFENINNPKYGNSIFSCICSGDILSSIENMMKKGRICYIFDENADEDIFENKINGFKDISHKFVFLIGDQTGDLGLSEKQIDDLLKRKRIDGKKVKKISIGKESQLASSVISFIKYKLIE